MASAPIPTTAWQALLHRWWMAVFAEEDPAGLADALLAGLLGLPRVVAAFLDPAAPAAARWADDTGPDVGRGLVDLPADIADEDPPVSIGLDALRRTAPRLAEAVASRGGDRVLAAAYRSAAGAAGTVGVVVRGEDPDLAECLGQIRDILTASERARHERSLRVDQRVKDAILSEASLRMSSSLDIEDTLRAVVRMMVPALADGAAVHIDRAGHMAPVAVAHVDARRESVLADHLRHRRWAGAPLTRPHHNRAGHDDRPVPSGLPPGTNLDTMTVAVLRARGRDVGLLTLFHRGTSARRADPGFLRNLTGRAASAIDHAALYDQQRRDVISLQQHLLPTALPPIPGVEIAGAYRVAEHTLDVGGDFYGLVPRPDGTVSALIGDICGRGAEAAALTGLARHTLETLLAEGLTPDRAIDALNTKMLANRTRRFLTLAVADIAPDPALPDALPLRLFSAGHPPPLIVRRDGTVEETRCSGMLVGVRPELGLRSARDRLRLGEHLLLYTDGLTEARDEDGRFFEEELPAVLARLRELPLPELAEVLTTGAGRYRVDDDTAVLVFRHVGPTAVDESLPVDAVDTALQRALGELGTREVGTPAPITAHLRACRRAGATHLRLRVVGGASWTRIELGPVDDDRSPNTETVWTELS